MQKRLERLRALLARSNAFELELWVRMLLIHYHFHTSDRTRLELIGADARTLNLLTPTSFKGLGGHPCALQRELRRCALAGQPCLQLCRIAHAGLVDRDGAECVFNNRLVLIAEGAGIRFGARCLVGPEVFVTDSNSHDLQLAKRRQPDPKPQSVEIADDVFIGARAIILKGAQIGCGSVVAAGAVVPPRFQAPPLSIIAGNPAVIVGNLGEANTR